MLKKKFISNRAPKPVGLYPHARRVGNLLFLSGVGPRISGSQKIPFNDKNLINVGFVKKNKFYELMKGASLFVNTMKTGYGSQLKTITALSFGKTIIATNKAISGIEINSNFNNFSTLFDIRPE